MFYFPPTDVRVAFILGCRAENTTHVLASLDNQLSQLASRRAAAKAHQEEHEAAYKQSYKEIADQHRSSKKLASSGLFEDRMDVDEQVEGTAKGKGPRHQPMK